MTTYTAEQIIAIGGREWNKGGKHRVYLNDDVWTRLIGLEIETYKSGNISSATLGGERISNAEARRYLDAISGVYWENGKIVIWANRTAHHADKVPAMIRAAIARAVAELDQDDDQDDDQGNDAPAPSAPSAAEQITALRQAGRSVRDIAQMIGCAVSTVYRWLRGVHRPSVRYATALAALTI